MNAMAMAPELQLPWESSREEDARYRRILRNALPAFLAFALLVPLLPVEEPSRAQQAAVPPHLARVILEKKELPRPPARKAKPKPTEKTRPKTAPKPVARTAAEPLPEDRLEQARKLAAESGVLAFQDALSEMREDIDVASLNQTQLNRGQADAATTQRSIITSAANSGSGGVKTAARSRDSGGPALSARETTRVQSSMAARQVADAADGSASRGGRSDESIRRVMDSNKGGIFAIYNRALRRNPMLQGKLVFEMVIEASGDISDLKLLSSEFVDEELTKKLLGRIRMIRFEAADVLTTRVNYSFDFLPY